MTHRIIFKYLARTIISMIVLVLLVLAGLEFFILLVSQLGDLGHGSYNLLQAIFYVLTTLPLQVYSLFPLAALLGCLLGLGTLANHSELIVLQAAGMSPQRISAIVMIIAGSLVLLVSVLGETLGPHLSHDGENSRAIALSGGQALRTEHGTWLRNDNRYIRIESIEGNHLIGITIYDFDSDHHLLKASHAATADYVNHYWILKDVAESILHNDQVTVEHQTQITSDLSLNPKMFGIETVEPAVMDLAKLAHYIHYRRNNGLQAASYQLIFWQRILQPLASVVMMFLAIPFIFGPLRTVTTGVRIISGVVVGFSFYMLNEFLGPASLLFQFPPLVSAALPTVMFALVGFVLFYRQHRGLR